MKKHRELLASTFHLSRAMEGARGEQTIRGWLFKLTSPRRWQQSRKGRGLELLANWLLSYINA